jgi:hypothetical protein
MNGTLGATTPSTVVATTVKASTTMGVGGATPSASGSGISFPATQSASTDANTLDDYEEGTWTPTLSFGGASVGITYSIRKAEYVKIGRNVLVNLYLAISNKGSSTGNAQIGGFPFNAGSGIDFFVPTASRGNLNTSGEAVSLYSNNGNTTTFVLFKANLTGGSNSNVTDTSFNNSTEINFNFWYQANA